MAKRKRSTAAAVSEAAVSEIAVPTPSKRVASSNQGKKLVKGPQTAKVNGVAGKGCDINATHTTAGRLASELSDVPDVDALPGETNTGKTSFQTLEVANAVVNGKKTRAQKGSKATTKEEEQEVVADAEVDNAEVVADEEEAREALSRPPAVDSDYLPLPWRGRLGYACLNTYLRYSNPPVFSSRTCRIASILEQRHPLKDPSQPHHPTKNRPDKEQTPDEDRGMAYVQSIGLANARDIKKMILWNERYGIKFLRLSSEMFPFASHDVYGYKLAPFAAEVLKDAGEAAAKYGHRLTTHPGQFTQLGSPRKEVIKASIRDLEYHSEMLSLLKLPAQQDRDAMMILHMGGTFGDKAATLDRFRENYALLPQDVKNRLVLENDDVCWTVHDLLPICKELNIPLVLDFHHHNILHDESMHEGTLDIMSLYDEIRETWTRKGITQKMHYSEPEPQAITAREMRKHSPRVKTLPPCSPDMDLMIEAKDKEQAVFELMKIFKLPGFERIANMIPHIRVDENKPEKIKKQKASMKKKKMDDLPDVDEVLGIGPAQIPSEEVGMGGTEGRVYWPLGMEEWLRPAKIKRVKKEDPNADDGEPQAVPKKGKKGLKARAKPGANASTATPAMKDKPTPKRSAKVKKQKEATATSTASSVSDLDLPSSKEEDPRSPPAEKAKAVVGSRASVRGRGINYAEGDD